MSENTITAEQAYCELHIRKRELDAQLKEVKAQIAAMQEGILQKFEDEGIQSMRTDRGLIYVARELWAGTDGEGTTEDKYERACEAMRRNGLAEYVQERFNTMSLSSYFRNLEKEDEGEFVDLCQVLGGVIKVTEVFKAKVRK